MPSTLKIAAVQMTGVIGETEANLRRADALVTGAARAGAQLVVLPECFNTGYAYREANYDLAEPPDGPTRSWLLGASARLGVHLAGSWLLRRQGEIVNTLTAAAPDGRTWEYDKLHPWGWERAYFRPGDRPVVAETDLGRLGLVICWDAAYPDLFQAYAGRVQMLVVCSSPPQMHRLTIHFPSGQRLYLPDHIRLVRAASPRGDALFDEDLRAQAAWLGVPLASAMPHGHFASGIVRPALFVIPALLASPRAWPLVRYAGKVTISAPYFAHTLIAGADGRVRARPAEGDGFALAEVEIPPSPPPPSGSQPQMQLPPVSYWLNDILNRVSRPVYDRWAKRDHQAACTRLNSSRSK